MIQEIPYTLSVRRSNRFGRIMRVHFASSLFAAIVVPFMFSEYGAQLHSLLAIILLGICLYPSARYFSQTQEDLPALAVLCAAYGFQFAIPVFTRESTIQLFGLNIEYLSDPDVTAALLLSILGVTALQLGYHLAQRGKMQKLIPVAHLPLHKSKALIYCALVGILVPAVFSFKGIIPDEIQQPLSSIVRLFQNQILVVIGVLGWIVYSRKESRFYQIALYTLVLVTSFRGISTGFLEDALVPIGVFFIVKWRYTNKLPVMPILATIALILFLSPVKEDYRKGSEDQEVSSLSAISKATLWIEQATEYWGDTFSGIHNFREATESGTGRTDLIHQVAHIHSLTPSVIPFQYGATYSYFAVALIPRLLWPDKPVAGSANSYYAVAYGITNEEGAQRTTFGASILGEAYINFGWSGVIFMMFFQGIVISLLQLAFGRPRSGAGGQAVFLAFFVFFLNGIGSSAEILFGNILQNLIFGYVLLLWAREKPSRILKTPDIRNRLTTVSLTRGTTS